MSVAAPPRLFTPEDLLALPDGDRYELVDGRLLERQMSFWSSYVAGRVYLLLSLWCLEHRLGWVAPEGTSYRCFPDDLGRVRRADASFLTASRLTANQALVEGFMPLAPDLVAEVLSPHDLVYEVDQKVLEWLGAGVRLVWVINPRARLVRIHRADGSIATVPESGELSGEDVVPGFRCPAADLFAPPPGVMLTP